MRRPPNPTRWLRRGARSQLVLRCPACGTGSASDERYCQACGGALFEPPGEGCLVCERTELPARARHCPDCGAYLPERRRATSDPERSLGRLALAGMALAVLLAALGSPGASPAPSLAGIRVGDSPATVRARLGPSERNPARIFWNDDLGQAHRVELWRYGTSANGDPLVADLTVTFLDGRVYQVGTLAKGYPTSEGLKVGDRMGRARQLYGTPIEEDRVAGLVPFKFLRGRTVIKVVTMPRHDEVLAVGLESPDNLPLPGDNDPDPAGQVPRGVPRQSL